MRRGACGDGPGSGRGSGRRAPGSRPRSQTPDRRLSGPWSRRLGNSPGLRRATRRVLRAGCGRRRVGRAGGGRGSCRVSAFVPVPTAGGAGGTPRRTVRIRPSSGVVDQWWASLWNRVSQLVIGLEHPPAAGRGVTPLETGPQAGTAGGGRGCETQFQWCLQVIGPVQLLRPDVHSDYTGVRRTHGACVWRPDQGFAQYGCRVACACSTTGGEAECGGGGLPPSACRRCGGRFSSLVRRVSAKERVRVAFRCGTHSRWDLGGDGYYAFGERRCRSFSRRPFTGGNR